MVAGRRVFLGGQAVSVLGNGFALLAVPLLVLELTSDPLAAGLAAAPRGIGYLLVGLPAGPLVDRLNPWSVLIGADLVRTGAFVGLPLLSWSGTARLWNVLALAFLAGVATVFFDAGLAVAVKDLFPTEGLVRANAALETATQASLVVGPALVGLLAATLGVEVALMVNAATFGVSLLTLFAVAERRPAAHSRRLWQGLGGDFRQGLRFLVGFRPLLILTILQTLLNVCLGVDTLIIYLARVTLGLSASVVGILVAVGGVGGLVGALMAPWLAARAGALVIIAVGVGIVAGTLTTMGLGSSRWALLVAYTIQVWSVTLVSVVNRSMRQALIPRELMGRVTTAVRALFVTATPIGAAVAGGLAKAFGGDPRPAFLAAGILTAVILGVGWFAMPREI